MSLGAVEAVVEKSGFRLGCLFTKSYHGDLGTLILSSDHPTDYVYGFKLRGAQAGEPLTELPIPARYEFAKIHTEGRIAPVTRLERLF